MCSAAYRCWINIISTSAKPVGTDSLWVSPVLDENSGNLRVATLHGDQQRIAIRMRIGTVSNQQLDEAVKTFLDGYGQLGSPQSWRRVDWFPLSYPRLNLIKSSASAEFDEAPRRILIRVSSAHFIGAMLLGSSTAEEFTCRDTG